MKCRSTFLIYVSIPGLCVLLLILGGSLAEEVGQQPLTTSTGQVDEAKEKLYRSYVGEHEYVCYCLEIQPLIQRYPLITRISEPFKEGHTIHAVGRIRSDPEKIDVNFKKGSAKNADIPFHLSVRFKEGLFTHKIVFNNYKDGNWSDKEERISSPYVKSEPFDIRVRIIGGKYKVYGNRKYLGEFTQREPLDGVDTVTIEGGLDSLRVFHYGGAIFANPYTAVAKLTTGKRLDVSGIPSGSKKRFNINLYRSNYEYALQLSIRYGEGAIVRNSMVKNEWVAEEREGDFPLNKNDVFDVTIVNESFGFQIFVNGKRFCAYAHRGDANDVETMEIEGDVELHQVTINDAVPT